MNKPLKITWLGLRGFPNVQGGIEKHAENMCPLLSDFDCDITVIVRKRYQPTEFSSHWRGVKFVPLWSPRSKHLETIVHSCIGVLWAAFHRPDILHIHGIGPALTVPLARLLGLRVVVTHHGADYEREKWGKLARTLLKVGERFSTKFANRTIVISRIVQKLLLDKYNVRTTFIPNGVPDSLSPPHKATLHQLGLTPHKYILTVSRLVPEKRHFDLLEAFESAGLNDWKLVIVGSSDTPDAYEQQVRNAANKLPNVVCTGALTGEPLQEIYTNAGVFVLPSSHEGLSITLLEAMSYGLPVIASAIPANLSIQSGLIDYYSLGDTQALSVLLRRRAKRSLNNAEGERARRYVSKHFKWSDIAYSTHNLYRKTISKKRAHDLDSVSMHEQRLRKANQ